MAININLSGAHPLQNPYMGGGQFGSSPVGGIPMMQLMYGMVQMMMQMMGGGPAGGCPMQMAPGQFGSPGGFGGNPMMGGGSPLGGFLGGGGFPGTFLGRGGFSGGSGGYPGAFPRSSGNSETQSASGPTTRPGPATGNLVDLGGGKKVDASIAGNVQAMIQAARREGVDLKISSAYRSRQQQEALYQKYLNGTGNLAAKPGTSNHESGLAIDFSNTPGAYAWLKANAGRFGLKNLPSEPWHYSTNGR
jgi:hypothetical protein|tara:strand:+ start:142 stop:885 length:744 start_codon:yes stop_codon:yes gene_type:complete